MKPSIRNTLVNLVNNEFAMIVISYVLMNVLIRVMDNFLPNLSTELFAVWWGITSICFVAYALSWGISGRYVWYGKELLRINARMLRSGSRTQLQFNQQESAVCYMLGKLTHNKRSFRSSAKTVLQRAHTTGEIISKDMFEV